MLATAVGPRRPARATAMKMTRALLASIDAIYREGGTDREWLSEIVSALEPVVDAGLGVTAYTHDASDPRRLQIADVVSSSSAPSWFEQRVTGVASSRPPELVRRLYLPSPPVVLLSEILKRLPAPDGDNTGVIGRYFPYGIEDAIGIRGTDPSGIGCMIAVPLQSARPLPPRARATLSRVAAHLAAGRRLRLATASAAERGFDGAEAVFSATARLEHHAPAVSPRAILTLARAIRERSSARARLPPAKALALWEALVAGRYSIVDRVDTDGKRFLLARRNDPRVREPLALTYRERQVLSYAALGHSNKFIAYELGLAPATVATHLGRGMQKLRVRSRQELAQTFPPSGAKRGPIDHG